MNTDKIYGFGIVGTGAIADIHADAIKSVAGAKLIGVYNRNYDKAKSFSEKHGGESFEDLDTFLDRADIDIICICTPSGLHEEMALLAIRKGKHCLIEKPLEINTMRCDQMISEAKRNGVQLGVVFQSRFYPESRAIKEAIDRNWFGKLAIGSAYVKWSRTEAYYKQNAWRGTWAFDGGGALMNQGIHAVDVLQWYMGEVESVQAMTGNFRHEEIEVEDTVVAILRFKNGALGTIECSTALYPGFLKRIEITGTEGSAVIEDADITKWEFMNADANAYYAVKAKDESKDANGGVSNPMAISSLGHQLQITDFINALNASAKPFIDGEEGRKSVRIIEAIYESARTGKPVYL
ncbi:oxidoreductase domain protein [Pseudopedobacter saltans DSM 12145]|uniref:Oxidoreductase domain protein n=1 Tax=Pseudopedobacter saltans (strain ATCC 51119 / DSM 12145 / JCM 21818 / CCUG 39354 / LMG 10337 / NBRC 100064 / NCIMB 13643) TaxID=762903 RepID=F0SCB2_PSESL|nr:Gfo/Idh/MocA family oxidoreductase [Pseudopedobacter saltans]ADY51709.1 oxidoreductase domain protein [Pseudopedobacter saltans DSM 12145]